VVSIDGVISGDVVARQGHTSSQGIHSRSEIFRQVEKGDREPMDKNGAKEKQIHDGLDRQRQHVEVRLRWNLGCGELLRG